MHGRARTVFGTTHLRYPAAVAVMAPASAHCPRLPQPQPRSLISHLEEALHCALVEALVVVHIPRAAISRTLRTSRRLAKAKADAQPVMQHELRLAVLEGVVVPMTQQGASGSVGWVHAVGLHGGWGADANCNMASPWPRSGPHI